MVSSRWQVEVTFEARAHLGLNLNVNGHHGRLPTLRYLLFNRDPRGSSATSASV